MSQEHSTHDGIHETANPAETASAMDTSGAGEACPIGGYCRTTHWIRTATFGLVLVGAAAYGAITLKPELAEYVPIGIFDATQKMAPSNISCGACAAAGISECHCHDDDSSDASIATSKDTAMGNAETTSVCCTDGSCPHCRGE